MMRKAAQRIVWGGTLRQDDCEGCWGMESSRHVQAEAAEAMPSGVLK